MPIYAVMCITAVCLQIYRSVLLSSRHHKTDQTVQSTSPSSAVKDERRTRRDKTSGNEMFHEASMCALLTLIVIVF